MARTELLKRLVGGIVTGSTRQNVTKESIPHPPTKCQLVHHNRPFHIPVTLPIGCSYYPNVATKLCQIWYLPEHYSYAKTEPNVISNIATDQMLHIPFLVLQIPPQWISTRTLHMTELFHPQMSQQNCAPNCKLFRNVTAPCNMAMPLNCAPHFTMLRDVAELCDMVMPPPD